MASPALLALGISSSKPLSPKAHRFKFLGKPPLRSVSRATTASPFRKAPTTFSPLQVPMAASASSLILVPKPTPTSLLPRPKVPRTTKTPSMHEVPKASSFTSTVFPKLLHSSASGPVFTPQLHEPFVITAWDGDTDDETDDNIMVEEVYKNPFLIQGSEFPSDVMETDDALYARFDMPGIGKEGLKLYMDKCSMTLHIEAEEGKKDPECNKEETELRKYSTGILFSPGGRFMTDKVKASMKDGVLRVMVPKIKLEEKMDVMTVTVD